MNPSTSTVLFACLAVLSLASAQTVLIDYDDGDASNGIHQSSVRNGGFEDINSTDFPTTPFWDSYFVEGDSEDPTRTTDVRTGSLRSLCSGFSGSGTRIQPSQTIPSTDWTIAEGDVFTLSFWVKQGSLLDKFDECQVVIDVVDGTGTPVLHNGSSELLKTNFPVPADDAFGLVRAVTPAIPAGSAHIGHQLRFRILADAERDEFIILDDVSLIAENAPSLPPITFPSQPNIVIIYGDDVGYGDVSSYGSGIVPTPHLNSLSEEGIRFTDGHSPASTCTPSRFSLLTGEYAWRTPGTGIASGVSPLLIRPGSVTLPSMLQQAGYQTAVVGKWHLGMGGSPTDYNAATISPSPLEIGFDYWYGIPATNDRVPCIYMENHNVVDYDIGVDDPLLVSFNNMVGNEPTGSSNPELLTYYTANSQHNKTIINGISRIGWMDGMEDSRWRDEDHAYIFDEKAGNFIAANAASSTPFFLFYASPDIHVPRAPHEDFQGDSPHSWRGDALLQLDWTVGALLDRLDDPNGDGNTADSIANNTIVIFSSDNGPVGNDGYNDGSQNRSTTEFNDGHDSNGIYDDGKYSIKEGGTRVPFLIRWPGTIPAGITSDALVSATDFMSSFARLVGQPLPTDAGPDSVDVLDAFLGRSETGRTVLITQNNGQNPKGVRRDNWKLLSNNNNLYNLDNDPGETNNVGGSNTAIRSELQTILTETEATPMTSPLVGWWPFDDGSGSSARDISGFDRAADLSGSPTWGTDSGLPHLNFDGSNDEAEVTGLPSLDDDFSVTTWARSSTATWATSGALVSRRPQFALVPVSGTTQIQFIVYSGPSTPQTLSFDLSGIAGFDLTAWHSYAASYDASTGTASIYVDGEIQATTTFTAGSANSDNGPVFLGSDEGITSFSGDLSDTRLYTGLLTPQRIANSASGRLDDADGDGMLSDWEFRYTLDPFNPADASTDLDNDTISNLDEFNNNTNPVVANTTGGGLVAEWALDESSGSTAPDSSGNGHNGTLINGPVWSTGPGRTYLDFDGVDQYVDVSSLPNLNSQVTAACWARSDTANWNIAGTLISRRPQFVLHPWANSMRISMTLFTGGGSQTHVEIDLATIPGFDLTEWHHYAGTYDSGTGFAAIYVDGVLRASQTLSPGLLDSTSGDLHLGRDVTKSRYLAGDIDQAEIYDRALSAAEIVELTAGFDDDQDGLDDSFERQLIEASPAYTTLADVLPGDDPDNDGSDNLEESIAGTDPLDDEDFYALTGFQTVENEGSTAFFVSLDGRAGRTYTLQQSTTMNGDWSDVVSEGPLASDGPVTLTQLDPPAGKAFFRVVVNYNP